MNRKSLSVVVAVAVVSAIGATAIAAPPAPGRAPQGIAKASDDARLSALETRIGALEAENAKLRTALVVAGNGDVTLQSPSGRDVLVRGADVRVDAAKDIRLQAGRDAHVVAAKDAEMKAGAIVTVRGVSVKLNNGTKPVTVAGSPVAGGKVLQTASTVFAP